MNEIEVFDKLTAIATPQFVLTFGEDSEQAIKIAEHININSLLMGMIYI